MKQFSIGVILYMFAGITWWGVLLYKQNQSFYELRLVQQAPLSPEYEEIVKERKRQAAMIVGEGVVLGLSLIAGIWIIYRSGVKQIQAANNQNNFLLSVSHELKSPIASIKLALQTLQRRKLSQKDREEVTANAVKDADRLEGLVQNILLSAGVDNDKFEILLEPVPINHVLNKVVEKINDQHKRSRISMHIDETSNISIDADQLAIELAMTNIIDNALKYSEDPSKVMVGTEIENGRLSIQVKDEGIGIDEVDLNRIFDRFWRSSHTEVRHRKGTGLGLYIAKVIAEAHNGTISACANSPDPGMTFVFNIPIHQV